MKNMYAIIVVERRSSGSILTKGVLATSTLALNMLNCIGNPLTLNLQILDF